MPAFSCSAGASKWVCRKTLPLWLLKLSFKNGFLTCVFFILCVIGLAPPHISFKDQDGMTNIDFNVDKSDRSVLKVSGKRKKVLLCSSYKTFTSVVIA
ncbi:hypothetical protein Bca4012_062102 [Brassica carinata]